MFLNTPPRNIGAVGFPHTPPFGKGGRGGIFKSNKLYLTILRRLCDGEFSFLSYPKSVVWYPELIEKNRFRLKDCRNDR